MSFDPSNPAWAKFIKNYEEHLARKRAELVPGNYLVCIPQRQKQVVNPRSQNWFKWIVQRPCKLKEIRVHEGDLSKLTITEFYTCRWGSDPEVKKAVLAFADPDVWQSTILDPSDELCLRVRNDDPEEYKLLDIELVVSPMTD